MPGEASAFIQWKGTDVCMDFCCDCGWRMHIDGLFAYNVKCSGCGQMWKMPSSVALERTGPDERPFVTDDGDDEQ